MASQIELTARDLARVGHEATALAGAMQKTTEDALRIAQKAVEMAGKIAQVPAGGSSTPPGGEPQK